MACKETPTLNLTAEAHHTLEVFEDYLLNAASERDSFSLRSEDDGNLEEIKVKLDYERSITVFHM